MADDESDFNEEWDEYAWERFLQQQDRATERYLELLEKYENHPDKERIIAWEMGWEKGNHLSQEEFIFEFEGELEGCEEEDIEALELPNSGSGNSLESEFAEMPFIHRTRQLRKRIKQMLKRNPQLNNQAEMIRLSKCIASCGAKLAMVLCQDDFQELGMTIAYLKRGLKSANDALSACEKLVQDKVLTRRQLARVREDIFALRNSTVNLMGKCRTEWRKGNGADGMMDSEENGL